MGAGAVIRSIPHRTSFGAGNMGERWISLSYDGSHVTTATDSAGREVTYSCSEAGDLVGVRDPAGATTTYDYDSSHRVVSVASAEHPDDPFVANVYDGDVVSVQYDGYGSNATLSYDTSAGVTTMRDWRGNTFVNRFDDEFRLTAEIDGAGYTTERTYGEDGLIASVIDANEHTTSFTYDANGNQTRLTDAVSHIAEAAYDLANNNPLWSEDAEGVRTTYAYDGTGTYLESVSNPVFTLFYEHLGNGLVESMTIGEATTSYEYDAKGNLAKVTNPLGAESSLEYDTVSRVTTATDALGRSVGFGYDAAGRLTCATDPLGESVTFGYDDDGNRTSAADELGKTTEFAYDVMDKLAGVTDPLTNSWAYTYDPNYNLKTVTNPRGKTTTYTYTANDLLEEVEDPLGHVWSFTHDGAGNTLESEHPTGETVTRTYTPDDLVATSTFSTGQSYVFTYAPTDRLDTMTDASDRVWTFDYNPVGWLFSATDDADGHDFVSRYAYDEAGRVTGVRLSSDEDTATYTYDLGGNLTSLTLPGASTPATFAADASGARTRMALPNGAATTYGYDDAGRIDSIVTTAASGVIAEHYTRDEAGRVTSDTPGAYGYDDAGRLASWYDPSADATSTYTYDAASNLTGVSVDGSATASFTYDAADRITSPGFSYDAAGNLTSDGERTFTYDAACRLTSVTDASTQTTVATYTYDAFNRRTSATEGTATVFFHYAGASARVIAETDAAGATLATYAYDSSGALFSMSRGGETYYYHTNARGDVLAMTDATGALVNTYAYDPWGQLLSENETVANPYRYASYRYDEATGLSYCWNRYYAPELARFLTRDIYPGELSDPVTMKPYLYCGADPVNAVDPSGLFTVDQGRYASAQAFGAGGSLLSWWCVDTYGNAVGYETLSYDAGAIPAASAGRMVGISGAPTALDRVGASAGGAFSCELGGLESAAARARDGSMYGSLALQVGPSAILTGAEVHGTVSWTTQTWHVYLPDLIFGYGSSVTPVPSPQNPLASREI